MWVRRGSVKNARKNSRLTDRAGKFYVPEVPAEELRFCCRYLVANAGNFDAPVFGLVLAIERNDDARESFDDVRVACGSAIESPCADALNDFHYFLFCLSIVAANQHIPQRRIHVAQVDGRNIVQRTDNRGLPGYDLLRFLQSRARRRHKWLPLVERYNGVDNNLACELPFEIRDHLGMSFVGHCDDDKVGTFNRGLICCSFYFSGAQTRLKSFNSLFGLLRVARSNDNSYAWRPETERQCAAEVSS